MKTTTEYRLQFRQLVLQAEQEIHTQPKAYRLRLKLLALLGYGVIVSLLVLLIGLVTGSLWAAFTYSAFLLLLLKTKLIFVLLGLIWVLGRSLLVRIGAPQGFALSASEYPQIWEIVERLRQQLQTPRIHTILITPEMNAAITQTARLGLIGPTHNTLIIGLELMLTLNPEQMRAVLAHELAHLSAKHNQFSAWIYRVRLSWVSINQALSATNTWGTSLIKRFFAWYEPYFSGYSYVLARDNEYEADALSKRLTSKETAASALVAVHVYGELINQHFWQPLYQRAYQQAQVENTVFEQLQSFLQNKVQYNGECQRYLHRALTYKTDAHDTHPSLMERLKALKSTGLMTPEADHSSAVVWLGHHAAHVVAHFSQQWANTHQQHWETCYNNAQQALQEIAILSQCDRRTLTQDTHWRLIGLMEEFSPSEDALLHYQKYYADYPHDLHAALAIGRLLVQREDEAGIHYLSQAMQSFRLQEAAAEQAWRYYGRQQNEAETEKWLQRLESIHDMLRAAHQERQTLSDKDTIIAPDAFEQSALAQQIEAQLAPHPKVKSIWIAQKSVTYFPENPVFIVAVQSKGWFIDGYKLQQALLNRIESEHNILLITEKTDKKLMHKVMNIGKLMI